MDADETSVQVDLSAARLRDDAEQIWRAGVAAVAPNRLIRGHLVLRDQRLRIDKVTVDLREIGLQSGPQ